MGKSRILIVDDEPGMLEVCADTLEQLPDAEIVTERDSKRAAELLGEGSFDLLVTDIRMSGMDGMSLLRHGRELDPELPVLMLTAYPTIETAVEAMRLGAADYVSKPFAPEDFLANVVRLLEDKRLNDENRLLRRQLERSYSFGEIVGQSPEMNRVFDAIKRLSSMEVDVLILGATGTGKELVARALHQHSRRAKGPFVPVDCGAIPEQLMESEFFGHERGAFSGAYTRNLGLMEYASGGTFFMDEITQLSPVLQAKLLRVLQERRIRRVGSTREVDLDVRLVFACAENIDDPDIRKRFRDDFFHRINVARVQLPKLSDRQSDIPLLVDHFVQRLSTEMNTPSVSVDPEALEVLQAYCWPGNVRELQNALKRAIASASPPVVSYSTLPEEIVGRSGESDQPTQEGFFGLRERHLQNFELDYLRRLLSRMEGDVAAAAREAKLPRGTLYRLLKRHDLDPAEFRDTGSAVDTIQGLP